MTTCLHTLFEEQAELHPNAAAIKSEMTELSYQALNERSNQLANFLRSKGVKTGDKVKLCLERSIEMVVGILGILKSGAAYVPINPKIPMGRFDFLSDDVDSPFLVTNNDLFRKMPKIASEQKVVCLDMDLEVISTCSTDLPNIKIQDSNIAVILYTSGSTGYPKGVLLSHKSLVNRLIWDRETYKHTPNDIVLQHASYTFDFSILEMFMALANGGKLVLARPEFHYESFYLIELIQREKITKMGSVPSLLRAYIYLPGFEKCTSLKQVFLGGEVLHYDLQNTFFNKLSAELINIYGPTETSISALHWTCKRNNKDKIIPIGFPAANMRIYLLDEKRGKVLDGDVGEIYIAGVGVAGGYHNRHELTAKHFLPDPFIMDKEARMYKTGDLGKKLPNGAIQFLGRKDNQIKVRGLRIELQEIEHYLALDKRISACVVSGIENKSKDMKLVAYVIPASGIDLNIADIRNSLLSKLPDYMVPSFFVQMSEFPFSPNGKIDRKALPYPDNVRLLSQTSYTPPANEIQRDLIRIWEKVLQLKPIGVTDSFDKLGGDSLSAIKIHLLMESEVGCTLPLSSFANANTIQEQAKIIDANTKILNSSKLIHFRSAGEKPPIIFVMPVQGMGYIMPMTLMRHFDPDHPFLGILPFEADSKNIPDSIEEYAWHYIQLLENQYPRSEYIIGGYSMGGLVAFEMASILQDNGRSIKSLFLLDTFHPTVLRKKVNTCQILDRVLFYLKKIVKGNRQTKEDIIKHLITRGVNPNKSLFQKVGRFRVLRRLQSLFEISPENKMIDAEITNRCLSLRFAPRHYNGNVLLISAKGDKKSHFYFDLPHLKQQEENVRKWADDILGKLFIYEIPGTHSSIMKDPDIEIVAHIINEHLM